VKTSRGGNCDGGCNGKGVKKTTTGLSSRKQKDDRKREKNGSLRQFWLVHEEEGVRVWRDLLLPRRGLVFFTETKGRVKKKVIRNHPCGCFLP